MHVSVLVCKAPQGRPRTGLRAVSQGQGLSTREQAVQIEAALRQSQEGVSQGFFIIALLPIDGLHSSFSLG